MNILLCNDDGYKAEGIHILKKHLLKYGNVYLIAPKRHQSGASHSISLSDSLEFVEYKKDEYYLDSTPADCVRVSVLLNKKFDIVFSGINDGLNLGTDIIYSGTVSAAREAVISGIPGVAISTDFNSFEIADKELDHVLDLVFENKMYSKNYVLNINFPTRDFTESKGIKIAMQGEKVFETGFKYEDGKAVPTTNVIRIAEEEENDAYLSTKGYITIVPLDIYKTNLKAFNKLKESLDK